MKIKFYLSDPLGKLFPPVAAKSIIPDWYKKLQADLPNVQKMGLSGNNTVKRCVPVLDYMTSGYIIKTYADIMVKRFWSDDYGEDISLDFKFGGEVSPIEFHTENQMPLVFNGHNKRIGKFNNLWSIETPPGYSCLFYQPEYFNEHRFKIFPGIVDTDEFTEPVSFPFQFSNTTENEEYIIEAGTPLACVFPFKRESWEQEIHEYDRNNKTSILMKTIWDKPYKRFMHSKKSYK